MFEGDRRSVAVMMPGFMVPIFDHWLSEWGLALDLLDDGEDDDMPAISVVPSMDRLTYQERRFRVVAMTYFVIFTVEFIGGVVLTALGGLDYMAGACITLGVVVATNFVRTCRQRNFYADTYAAWRKDGLRS